MTSNTISIREIKEKIVPILKDYPIEKAILFGSYSKGQDNNSSDIDIYIDTKGKLRGLDFVGLLEVLVEALGADIDLIDRSHIESNSLIIKEIENGGLIIYEKSKNYMENN